MNGLDPDVPQDLAWWAWLTEMFPTIEILAMRCDGGQGQLAVSAPSVLAWRDRGRTFFYDWFSGKPRLHMTDLVMIESLPVFARDGYGISYAAWPTYDALGGKRAFTQLARLDSMLARNQQPGSMGYGVVPRIIFAALAGVTEAERTLEYLESADGD